MTLSRRSLIGSLICLVAAPAIVRASSLMAVKPVELSIEELLKLRIDEAYRVMDRNLAENFYGDLTRITRNVLLPRVEARDYPHSPVLFHRI